MNTQIEIFEKDKMQMSGFFGQNLFLYSLNLNYFELRRIYCIINTTEEKKLILCNFYSQILTTKIDQTADKAPNYN